jgi:hypothetical protein
MTRRIASRIARLAESAWPLARWREQAARAAISMPPATPSASSAS